MPGRIIEIINARIGAGRIHLAVGGRSTSDVVLTSLAWPTPPHPSRLRRFPLPCRSGSIQFEYLKQELC